VSTAVLLNDFEPVINHQACQWIAERMISNEAHSDLILQRHEFSRQGYLLTNPSVEGIVDAESDAWKTFASTWQTMPLDKYLSSDYGYRYRYHNKMQLRTDTLEIQLLPFVAETPNEPSVRQSFVGLPSIERHISVIRDLIRYDYAVSAAMLEPDVRVWNVGVHQIRTACNVNQAAFPSGEGRKSFGARCIAIHLIDNSNIIGGSSSVYDLSERELFSQILYRPFDTLLLDESRVSHELSPIIVARNSHFGFRDVCVVTFEAVI
jgi:hypothetical protein